MIAAIFVAFGSINTYELLLSPPEPVPIYYMPEIPTESSEPSQWRGGLFRTNLVPFRRVSFEVVLQSSDQVSRQWLEVPI